MKKGLIWIVIGIGVIVYNHVSAGSMLVLRGTNIDYGYIAIGIGAIVMVGSMFDKEKQAQR
jgi:hypothetical protein